MLPVSPKPGSRAKKWTVGGSHSRICNANAAHYYYANGPDKCLNFNILFFVPLFYFPPILGGKIRGVLGKSGGEYKGGIWKTPGEMLREQFKGL